MTKRNYLFFLAILLFLNLDLKAQTRNWRAFQIGGGIHRSQILNNEFHKLVENDKISPSFGLNFSASYIINPLVLRANYFTEEFKTNDVNYVYNTNKTKLRGYQGIIGLNMIPNTQQILNIACGYKYSILGSFDESSKVISSKILKFPFWELGFTSNPLKLVSVSLNYSHPFSLSQENFSQISCNVYLNIH